MKDGDVIPEIFVVVEIFINFFPLVDLISETLDGEKDSWVGEL